MGYSGFNIEFWNVWKSAFVLEHKCEPSIEEAFQAGWELKAWDHAGYHDPVIAVKYLLHGMK